MRHGRYGGPSRVLDAALLVLDAAGLRVEAASPIAASAPLGPSRRRFANAAAIIVTGLPPPALLERLQGIEREFGRRRGRRWGPRVLDLDIVLWSAGAWRSPGLTIPHPRFRERDFVLTPARKVAPRWRDPLTGLAITHLAARLTASRARL